METLAVRSIRPEWIIAVIVRNFGDGATIEEISEKISILRQKGIDTSRVRVRRSPRGYYSEDIHQFVSGLFYSGFARELSPRISLKEEGIELCDEIIEDFHDSNPEAAKEVADALGINLKDSVGKN
jgi:hypothetical protein